MNKYKKSVALKYEKEKDIAPRIVAKGKRYLAEKIIEIAKQYNIPIYEDEKLADTLIKLELDEIIPPTLYEAVAKVLAWVYTIDKKYKRSRDREEAQEKC